MKKLIAVTSMLLVFLHTSFSQEIDRSSVVANLQQKANDIELKVMFRLDKYDDSILVIERGTITRPEKLRDWNDYFLSLETGKEQLKIEGFKWVRVYTLTSEDETHYLTIIL